MSSFTDRCSREDEEDRLALVQENAKKCTNPNPHFCYASKCERG